MPETTKITAKSSKIKKKLKWAVISIGSLILLLLLLFFIYIQFNKMDKAKSFTVNDPGLKNKILIATQGSAFKNSLSKGIINIYFNKDIYIKGVDVSELKNINSDNWPAILIVNSVEYGNIHKTAMRFISSAKNKNKIFVVATSSSGKKKPDKLTVDTITCASKKQYYNNVLKRVIFKISKLFKIKE